MLQTLFGQRPRRPATLKKQAHQIKKKLPLSFHVAQLIAVLKHEKVASENQYFIPIEGRHLQKQQKFASQTKINTGQTTTPSSGIFYIYLLIAALHLFCLFCSRETTWRPQQQQQLPQLLHREKHQKKKITYATKITIDRTAAGGIEASNAQFPAFFTDSQIPDALGTCHNQFNVNYFRKLRKIHKHKDYFSREGNFSRCTAPETEYKHGWPCRKVRYASSIKWQLTAVVTDSSERATRGARMLAEGLHIEIMILLVKKCFWIFLKFNAPM